MSGSLEMREGWGLAGGSCVGVVGGRGGLPGGVLETAAVAMHPQTTPIPGADYPAFNQ